MRIEAISSLVDKDTYLVDIGTDHGYLPIYLYEHNITKNIIASDISSKVLENTLANLKKYNFDKEIPLVVSDGFKNIESKLDTAVITGMGANTIMDILDSPNIPNTLILGPQKNTIELRYFMMNLGYKIVKEVVIKENNKYYPIIKYIKGSEELDKYTLLVGKSNNLEYINYLFNKYKNIYTKSKDKKYLEYINIIERKLDLH